MNFSPTPPCRSSAERAASKYERMSSNTVSASVASPIAVDPDRSQKTEVTSFRRSTAGAVRGAPHDPQNRCPRGLSAPQAAQGCLPMPTMLEAAAARGRQAARHSECQGRDRFAAQHGYCLVAVTRQARLAAAFIAASALARDGRSAGGSGKYDTHLGGLELGTRTRMCRR
jgi:hypothetical protein